MKKIVALFLLLGISAGLSPLIYADDPHDHGHDHTEEGIAQITNMMAEQVGIITAVTGAHTMQQTITSFGRLTTAPEQTSHVRARFPGVIVSVKVTIGDQVKVGDLLAVVESNESLKKYDVRAPIAGTIIQRHANAGEMTQEQVLFSISNFESLWAELRIFPSQYSSTSQSLNTDQSSSTGRSLLIDQPVYIVTDNQVIETKISHLLPAGEDTPYLIARAKVSGHSSDVFPGLMIEGRIVVSEFTATIAINNAALQSMEEGIGVFVKDEDNYVFTPLTLGRAGAKFTEVVAGINTGIEYVTENSYLIKADIEKFEAEHQH